MELVERHRSIIHFFVFCNFFIACIFQANFSFIQWKEKKKKKSKIHSLTIISFDRQKKKTNNKNQLGRDNHLPSRNSNESDEMNENVGICLQYRLHRHSWTHQNIGSTTNAATIDRLCHSQAEATFVAARIKISHIFSNN